MFDIIIPTFQNLEELKRCLQGLSKQTFPDFRILLCIDGIPNKINNFLMRNSFPNDIIPLQHADVKRHGRTATRNLALKSIQSEYLLLLDSDIIPLPELVERHYEQLKNQNCISLGYVEYTDFKTNYLADYIQSRGKNRYKDQEILPYKYITSQNVAMKSNYFIQIGGQDSAIVSYGGDIEFGYHLSKTLSIPLIYNKKAVGHATCNKDLEGVLKQMQEFGRITLPYIKQKYPEFNQAFRIDLITTKGLKSIFTRIVVNRAIAKILQRIVPYFPKHLRRLMIHYLFFQSIVKGYDSIKKK